jgi:hypothetical protein
MKTTQGAQGHEGAFLGYDTPRGTGAFPFIGNAPCDAPTTPNEGHAGKDFEAPIEVIPGQTRILLSEAASRHLSDIGADCFRIVSKARHPEQPGRWVIHLAPCPLAIARQAEGVLFGTHRAVKIKAAPKVWPP